MKLNFYIRDELGIPYPMEVFQQRRGLTTTSHAFYGLVKQVEWKECRVPEVD